MFDIDIALRRGSFGMQAKLESPDPGITAICGRSGSGKSTLLLALAGLLRPASGHIRVDGECWFDGRDGTWVRAEDRGVGCVFQDALLFPHLDVGGNLRYGRNRARGRHARFALDQVLDLLELRALLPRRIAGLSGGERQRVALGRALLSQPRLLLLDEPWAAVDPVARGELLHWFERVRDELALPVVLVTHQPDDVLRLADRAVLIDSGRVVLQGELQQVAVSRDWAAFAGGEAVGAVVPGTVAALDAASGLAMLDTPAGTLRIPPAGLARGQRVRVQLLARDLILATTPPQGISVRNSLPGAITGLRPEPPHNVLVDLRAASASLTARITAAAAAELGLQPGMPITILVKAVSVRRYASR